MAANPLQKRGWNGFLVTKPQIPERSGNYRDKGGKARGGGWVSSPSALQKDPCCECQNNAPAQIQMDALPVVRNMIGLVNPPSPSPLITQTPPHFRYWGATGRGGMNWKCLDQNEMHVLLMMCVCVVGEGSTFESFPFPFWDVCKFRGCGVRVRVGVVYKAQSRLRRRIFM